MARIQPTLTVKIALRALVIYLVIMLILIAVKFAHGIRSEKESRPVPAQTHQ